MACGYYCPYPMAQGKKYRKRSVKSLLAEIVYLIQIYGANSILFRDPYFSLDKKRTVSFAVELLESNLKINWACETRLDSLNESALRRQKYNLIKEINDSFIVENFFKSRLVISKLISDSVKNNVLGYKNKKLFKI